MKLLLDNTLIHRVQHVLESPSNSAIKSVDALGLFHLAEHILFGKEVVISSVEPEATLQRTAGVVEKLRSRGIFDGNDGGPALRFENYSEAECTEACRAAGWGVLEEVQSLDRNQLAALGRLADHAIRPQGIATPPIASWLTDPSFLKQPIETVANYASLKSSGSYALTMFLCPPLFNVLAGLHKRRRLSDNEAAAIGALIRVNVNQQLAGLRSGLVYAPAPKRALISQATDRLFRHQVERAIQQEIAESRTGLPKTLASLSNRTLLPLPMFAFHALRNERLGSPDLILDAARARRNDAWVVDVRNWLDYWEDLNADSDDKRRLAAIGELDRLAADVQAALRGVDTSVLASLQLNPKVATNPLTNEVELSFLEMPKVPDLIRRLSSRERHKRQFVAALTSELVLDEELGSRILQQLHRSVNA
ncbi:MAG: hypothetical protein FD138_2341 [Planctomycetota bacterium]|nr:MAG: hypothetical protein FD138_2341 [Planctomycetota bacterium]